MRQFKHGSLSDKSRDLFRIARVFLLFVGASLILAGCTTRSAIREVMLPYTVIKQTVIKNLPGGLREQSTNGRQLTSHYIPLAGIGGNQAAEDPSESVERIYSEVVILGASRPYNLDVKVIRERRARGSQRYRSLGTDKRLTEELANRLKQALADRREGGNIIDDFRAF